jgi:hypothetical protein
MKFIKENLPGTFQNAAGNLIAVGVLAAGAVIIAAVKPLRQGVVDIAAEPIPAYITLLVGLGGFCGWGLFLRSRRRNRSVTRELDKLKQKIQDLQNSPPRFSDECTFDQRLGLYKHKTRPEFFCGTCTVNNVVSPLRVQENGWMCLVDPKHWHRNPDYKEPQYQPVRPSRSWAMRGLDG